jgi:hypothetical protein
VEECSGHFSMTSRTSDERKVPRTLMLFGTPGGAALLQFLRWLQYHSPRSAVKCEI